MCEIFVLVHRAQLKLQNFGTSARTIVKTCLKLYHKHSYIAKLDRENLCILNEEKILSSKKGSVCSRDHIYHPKRFQRVIVAAQHLPILDIQAEKFRKSF